MKTWRRYKKFVVIQLIFLVGGALTLVSCHKAEETVKQEAAYLVGMEEYVYGFPLVIMDATRQVVTAVPKAGEYYAPINQLLKMRSYVDPNYKVVVRISRNSLWSAGVMDVGTEPMIVSIPNCKDVPLAVRWLNHWTDVFATAGSRTGESHAGNYLVVGPGWRGTPPANIKKVLLETFVSGRHLQSASTEESAVTNNPWNSFRSSA